MESPQQNLGLSELWREADSSALRCYSCTGSFEKAYFENRAIIRTFQPLRRDRLGALNPYSRLIEASGLQLAVFDRHLECLKLNDVRYIAISHVWNPEVSKANFEGQDKTSQAQEMKVRNYIFETVGSIISGLKNEIPEEFEIWYDYISVPQWERSLKGRIIDVIPDIFHDAEFTLLHLDDVSNRTLELLRHGKTTEERIAGVVGVCNAKWFRRVWTAMEYVRSDNIRVMDGHYKVMSGVRDCLLIDVWKVWNQEVAAAPSVHHVEAIADMGKNVVPWNLGPLNIGHDAKILDFGSAFSLLSKRGCLDARDFFTALVGIVKGRPKEPLSKDPHTDPRKAYNDLMTIAISCIEAGDYSPLLMMPRASEVGLAQNWYATPQHKLILVNLFERCGYCDVLAYGLGPLSGFPTYHSFSDFIGLYPTVRLKLGVIGDVVFAMSDTTRAYPEWQFLTTAQTVLTFTGPNVEKFVKTVTARLFNFCDEDVEEVLSDKTTCEEIHIILVKWYNTTHTSLFHDKERHETGKRLAHLLAIDRVHPKVTSSR